MIGLRAARLTLCKEIIHRVTGLEKISSRYFARLGRHSFRLIYSQLYWSLFTNEIDTLLNLAYLKKAFKLEQRP